MLTDHLALASGWGHLRVRPHEDGTNDANGLAVPSLAMLGPWVVIPTNGRPRRRKLEALGVNGQTHATIIAVALEHQIISGRPGSSNQAIPQCLLWTV